MPRAVVFNNLSSHAFLERLTKGRSHQVNRYSSDLLTLERSVYNRKKIDDQFKEFLKKPIHIEFY